MRRTFLLKSMLLLCALIAGMSSAWGQTAAVGNNLWSEPFKGTNTSTSFSATTSWGNYVNPTTLVAADASSLTYSSSNVMLNSATSTNMTDAHIWLKKQTTGVYFQVAGIKLYNASKVKVSWAQAGGAKVTVAYAFDSGSSFTDLSNNSTASSKFESSELIVSGHTTITLKFYRTNVNTNIRLDNLTLTVTAIGSNIAAPTFTVAEGAYSTPQTITINTNEEGGTTYYTIDGTTPTNASTQYTTPISISENTTLKAITYKNNEASNVTTAKYFFIEDGVFDFVGAAGLTSYGSDVAITTNSSDYIEEANTWTAGNVTMETSGKYRWWYNGNDMRFYTKKVSNAETTKITLTAPENHVITKVVFDGGSDFSPSIGSLTSGTWSGAANSITFTYDKSSGSINVNKISVTYKSTSITTPITIACEGGYASYSCDIPLDFTNSGAEAYIIKTTSENSASLTQVTKVPANTGIIVKGNKDDVVNVAIATGDTDDVTGNLLKGTVNTPKAVALNEAYGLSKTDGKFHLLNAGTIPANKAYLLASEVFQAGAAAVLDLDFGETTGVNTLNVERGTLNGECYNLNGQRIAQPTKGLYIVNGRKVVIK